MESIEAEAVNLIALISASEGWSSEYEKDRDSYGALLRNEARWQLTMSKFFRQIANDSDAFINWRQYNNQVDASYNIDVIIDDSKVDDYSTEFMRISLKFVTGAVVAGAASGESLYGIPLGLTSVNAKVQKLSTKYVANLVGRKVLKDGRIITNPNPDISITRTIRKDIAESIKTSLGLGETVKDAQFRVMQIIGNPKRAELIARTESINAYQSGLTLFGRESGAVGKEWLDVGAIDVCSEYSLLGPVPFDYAYGGSLDGPAAHPGCRCGRRLIYPNEWKLLQK